MFKPEEIIFAPTARCNLACAHCRVARVPEELAAADAIAFLREAAERGIERLGFSGGEPFLRPDFLRELCAEALSLGLLFDRLMTNGAWWRDEAELEETLGSLAEAGFDGVIGLSVDRWHGSTAGRILPFIEAAHRAFGRLDCVEIASVISPDDGPLLETLGAVAAALGGELLLSGGEPEAIVPARGRAARGARAEGESLSIDIVRIPYSAAGEAGGAEGGASGEGATGEGAAGGAAAPGPWTAKEWFEDDFCAGPGNVLYVHPNGKVAVCCGFANENEELIVGRIPGDGIDAILARAAASPRVRACYETGLGEVRKRLEAGGLAFPGKTADLCFFCDWLCKKGLGA